MTQGSSVSNQQRPCVKLIRGAVEKNGSLLLKKKLLFATFFFSIDSP